MYVVGIIRPVNIIETPFNLVFPIMKNDAPSAFHFPPLVNGPLVYAGWMVVSNVPSGWKTNLHVWLVE